MMTLRQSRAARGKALPRRGRDQHQHHRAQRYAPAGDADRTEILERERNKKKGATPDGADKK